MASRAAPQLCAEGLGRPDLLPRLRPQHLAFHPSPNTVRKMVKPNTDGLPAAMPSFIAVVFVAAVGCFLFWFGFVCFGFVSETQVLRIKVRSSCLTGKHFTDQAVTSSECQGDFSSSGSFVPESE